MNSLSPIKHATIAIARAVIVPVLLCLGKSAHARTILYVDQHATGPIHDGWTWCTAFTDLQDAMEIAVWDVTIRVANGTYTPERGTGDRSATFQLTTNVTVEGGYAGCGADDPDERESNFTRPFSAAI